MEDAHACVLDLQARDGDNPQKPADSDVRISYFGVYDGHGGDKVAIYTGEHLHEIIAKQEAFKKKDFEQALKDGFLAIDRAILSGVSLMPETHSLFRILVLTNSRWQIRNTRKRCLAAHLQSVS